MTQELLETVVEQATELSKGTVYRTMDVFAENTKALYAGPVNPNLAGGVRIDFNKSTPNTTILKETYGPVQNTYVHHDRGPGRMTINTRYSP